jgi:hypothetical protein
MMPTSNFLEERDDNTPQVHAGIIVDPKFVYQFSWAINSMFLKFPGKLTALSFLNLSMPVALTL